ncbi:glycosyl hydrolase [Prosthecochloris sp. GSB1]|uniref:glycosyltransferase n=1 Tax=Prosthecochloris sp. GSB1 TaxID=281093 RepID=UPI000B8CBF19|nr:glycosyltransferase [Prosthecochloris sp. GSB1]ASQ91287.1 glycosyl hydrolase [Prosthecochloris sp. GSB1]
MILYQLVVLFCLLLFLGILLWNLRELKPLLPGHGACEGPMVSVLVPARNEECNIEGCVRSLLDQDYVNYEVIVLDDGSHDRTPEILESLSRSPSAERLRVLGGEPLPAGWHGKAWACHQLGRAARGRMLLFTDADTRHEPGSVSASVGALLTEGADMLSLTPRQETVTFGERLVVPLVYFILLCYLPLRFVRTRPEPSLCFANGQFILFTRDGYERIGGHEAVRSDIVEDVWLCKAMKRNGGRVVSYDGSRIVHCRMYRSFSEVWKGFSKNLFAGIGYNAPGLFALMLMTAALYVVPYGFLFDSALGGDFSMERFWLPAAQIVVALACRLLVAARFSQPFPEALLHVVSQIVLLLLAFRSFTLVAFGEGVGWKGRRYDFSGKIS